MLVYHLRNGVARLDVVVHSGVVVYGNRIAHDCLSIRALGHG